MLIFRVYNFNVFSKGELLFMIDFQSTAQIDRSLYEKYLYAESEHGCELSYANLRMWGEQKTAIVHDQLIVFTKYNGKYMYHFPLGSGDKKTALEAIIEDARERKLPCAIFSLNAEDILFLENVFPGKFEVQYMRDSFDYVYSIEKLSGLKGRKYHRKRNHYNRFCKNFPNFYVTPVSEDNLAEVKDFIAHWYHDRLEESPENDYHNEQLALEKCFQNHKELGIESLVLYHNEEILAFTMGSRLSSNTFDVHFEKARWDVEGAYTAINCEFAKFIQGKYPEIEFLNREEDMGLEGLRKAKESYFPHHMVEKAFAILKENVHE